MSASNAKGHGMHSPFVFQFIQQVLDDKKHYHDYDEIEKLRNQLLNDHTKIFVEDFGAGSGVSKDNDRKISAIARNSAKSKKFAQLLFRIVRKYQPLQIIELGTSLGITTAYLSKAGPAATVHTIEGAAEVAKIAKKNFDQLSLQNINALIGNFDQVLAGLLDKIDKIDFAFIDGNHAEGPTLQYFGQMLDKAHGETIIVFDDIHWSEGMEKAWEQIKNNDRVRVTIDLFFFGVVFFRHEFREKQHFTIRF